METRVELLQKILLSLLQAPDTDSSDSDYDPSESESDDDYEDSEEEIETDLTHIDPKNILGTWLSLVIPKENSEKNL